MRDWSSSGVVPSGTQHARVAHKRVGCQRCGRRRRRRCPPSRLPPQPRHAATADKHEHCALVARQAVPLYCCTACIPHLPRQLPLTEDGVEGCVCGRQQREVAPALLAKVGEEVEGGELLHRHQHAQVGRPLGQLPKRVAAAAGALRLAVVVLAVLLRPAAAAPQADAGGRGGGAEGSRWLQQGHRRTNPSVIGRGYRRRERRGVGDTWLAGWQRAQAETEPGRRPHLGTQRICRASQQRKQEEDCVQDGMCRCPGSAAHTRPLIRL